ncbi:MAG: hypothetical protein ACHQT9_03010 [Candidatus Saccharimonadales bacterium]
MSDEELIGKTKQLLRGFRQIGLEQIKIFKELNPGPIRRTRINGHMMGELNGIFMPIEDVMRRIGTEENIFLVNMLDGFWNYYLLNSESIESPARQGIDRTLLELCYQKLLPFTSFTSAEKKRTLLISQLCDIGMILAAPSEQDRAAVPNYTNDYNYWVSQLSRETDKIKFERLQSEGYPTHVYAKAKHALWPSFFHAFNDNIDELIFLWGGSSPGSIASVHASTLRMYLHQHDFVHGSYTSAIAALEAVDTKKHIFTSCAISTQAGYQVLHTVNANYLSGREIDLTELSTETSQLVSLIFERFSHLG